MSGETVPFGSTGTPSVGEVTWAVAYEAFTATSVTIDQVRAMFHPIKLICIEGM
jgi:hypothetical protein